MRLTGERLRLSRGGRRSNPWRILVYLALIAGGLLFRQLVEARRVQPLFMPTPTPTRVAQSYALEARAHFSKGDLNQAIAAYERAVTQNPDDTWLLANLARVQTYSSSVLTSPEDRLERLEDARSNADRAVEINPEDGFAHTIRALVYDWLASEYELSAEELGLAQRDRFLNEALQASENARQLDIDSSLAMAIYAEVQLDHQHYTQAATFTSQAVNSADSWGQGEFRDFLMDVYRVHGTVLETGGQYREAIAAYEKAAEVAPNFTFLYLKIGVNHRQLREIDQALEAFDRAARINAQNGIEDPTPYLAIGKTYLQQGEFFVAARNVLRALTMDPGNPDIYGRLGVVYHKARNYESAIKVFSCGINGCTPESSEALVCELYYGLDGPCVEDNEAYEGGVPPLTLNSETLVYYYTYGSVLAFYAGSDEVPDACQEAERIFQILMSSRFGSDPTVADIVAEGRTILAAQCR